MKRTLALVILLLAGLRPGAAEPADTTFLMRADRFVTQALSRFQELTPVKIFNARDTTYSSPLPDDWTAGVRSNFSGTNLKAVAYENGREVTTRLASRHILTHTLGVTCKGITLAYSFNPFQRDWHDIQYGLSAYSNMAGIDFTYRTISSFRGYAESGGERIGDIDEDQASHHLLGINALYFFNYQRFSFPAGFNQSYIQHKSAGSLIAGLSFGHDQTSVPVAGSPGIHVNSRLLALGMGYGYTYVPEDVDGLLIMGAALPKFILFDSSRLKIEYDENGRHHLAGYDIRQFLQQPEVNLNLYLGVVKWFRNKYFTALTASLDGYRIGQSQAYKLSQARWETHLAFGVTF